MIAPPVRCVVDASVVVKLVVSEIDSNKAHALFAHLIHDAAAAFYLPDFCYLECANILWKLAKRGVFSVAAANANLAMIRALICEVVPFSTVLDRALALALSESISTYDAVYVAVSENLNLPLITADDKLAKKVASNFPNVLLLGALTIPSPPSATTP